MYCGTALKLYLDSASELKLYLDSASNHRGSESQTLLSENHLAVPAPGISWFNQLLLLHWNRCHRSGSVFAVPHGNEPTHWIVCD
jgi:hypothetical protein